MRDADVRRVLRQRLDASYGADANTVIVEELGLCRGTVRADVAVINGILKGYEIKSERDTLTRLANHAGTYSRVLDTLTIVVADRHMESTERIVPKWWGIEVATTDNDSALRLHSVRDEGRNQEVDAFALVQLLWRGEALSLLRLTSQSANLEHKPRGVLWRALADAV